VIQGNGKTFSVLFFPRFSLTFLKKKRGEGGRGCIVHTIDPDPVRMPERVLRMLPRVADEKALQCRDALHSRQYTDSLLTTWT
jgi:hypothetical protein